MIGLLVGLLMVQELIHPAPPPPPIKAPVWEKRPSALDFSGAYPAAAREKGEEGRVIVSCTVSASGHLQNCWVTSETPASLGFGEAALKLAPLFKMKVAPESVGARVILPVVFKMG